MLSPSEVMSAIKAGLGEASEAATRALGRPISLSAQSASPFLPDLLGQEYSAAGLVVLLKTDIGGVLLLIPESGGVLPTWYTKPNESQASQLATLAQEWGMTLWPESALPSDFKAARVNNLREAVARGSVGPDAGAISLAITSREISSPMLLLWPIEKPGEVIKAEAIDGPKPWQQPMAVSKTQLAYSDFDDGVDRLPRYARSLLKVKVPVRVTVARSKQPVGRILSLDQGSILNFTKSCEDPLDLEVGEEGIARGEVIRVGDKFGIRVTGMMLPEERFLPLAADAH